MSLEIFFEPPKRRSQGHSGPNITKGLALRPVGDTLDIHFINSRNYASFARITIPLSAIGDLISALATIALIGDAD